MPLALTAGSSTAVKADKRSYKEVQELLLLHRRYEEKAVRLFRKGLSDEKRAHKRLQSCEQIAANVASYNGLNAETRAQRKKASSKLQHDHEDLSKPIYLNDKEYFKQLLLKSDANGNFVDDHTATHSENRAQLRLPKLEGIPPENKEIFYTTLPKMPPLPKVKDSKVNAIKPHRNKKRNLPNSRDESSTFSSETCLTIRQLPRDHFMLHDFGNGVNATTSISAVPTFPSITPPREMADSSSEAVTSDEGHLWLVPFVNIEIPPYRLAKWNELESGSLSMEGRRRKDLQNGVTSDNKEIEESQPKYKRNVHFSEFLHEIHLYSPISAQSAMSKEDVNDINN